MSRWDGDGFTVLAAAHDATIKSAVEHATRYGLALYSDLVASRDPIADALRSKELGVNVILLHLGIDVQRAMGLTAAFRAEVVRKLASEVGGVIAVAGGVKPREAGDLASMGASIIIIGGAITASSDPRGQTVKAFESLKEAGFKCR